MTAKEASQRAAKNVWVQLGSVLVLALGGSVGGTQLLAQPRTDAEIRDIAEQQVAAERRVTAVVIENIEGDIADIKTGQDKMDTKLDKVLDRLPR